MPLIPKSKKVQNIFYIRHERRGVTGYVLTHLCSVLAAWPRYEKRKTRQHLLTPLETDPHYDTALRYSLRVNFQEPAAVGI